MPQRGADRFLPGDAGRRGDEPSDTAPGLCSTVVVVRYYVALDPDPQAKPVVVDLVELPSGELQAKVDDRSVDLDVVDLGAQLSVRIDGQVVDLTTEGAPPELGAVASGHRSYVRVESERMRAAAQAKKAGGTGGDRVIKSPMPGRVVKVLVAKGDTVEAGHGLVVLEAMKMENEVRAKLAGTVAEVHVTPGSAVEGNAKLITLA
jgi:glutaconyl-CoA/methylmalonyl-CoA decarboxylase subunit gamma